MERHPELDRRAMLGLLAAGAVASPARAQGFTDSAYARSVVIDMQGSLLGPPELARAVADAKTSGLTAISATMGLVGNAPGRLQTVVDDIASMEGVIDQFPGSFVRIRRASDLLEAKRTQRLGLIYNMQDTVALEGDLSRVKKLKDLGVRVLQLTYNKRNLCGDGCLEPGNAGLSDFGRQVVHEINANKVMLDLSHGGPRTVFEAAQASSAPPAVTHTGCRDLVNNPRNLYDRELRAVAEKGGVVGIYFMGYLRVGIGDPALNGRGEDVVRHIEHAVKICGEDHVGIGTDGGVSALVITDAVREFYQRKFEDRVRSGAYTPGDAPDVYNYVPEYNDPRRLLTLARDLAARGWTTGRLEKLLGGNFARLMTEVLDP